MTNGPDHPLILPLEPDGDERKLNIFRTLARNRPLYRGFLKLGGHLLTGGVLPAREREIVILRIGWRAGSEYEFGQHTVIGKAAGLTDDEIARLADSGPGEWDSDDRALVNMADELCDDDAVGSETWTALSQRWNEAEVLELLVLAGYYRLVSGLLNSVGVALEAGTPGWPAAAVAARRAPRDDS
ncbi:MAG TPA: carboxymuconolactone decarboxylase family protein [Candidatus Solibacter sp.]|jgi:4-carboxymuconolactone decarboxylase|nr:carboxymuconolactone decarboxylase family protein [Candidatus Solibacter sp.]